MNKPSMIVVKAAHPDRPVRMMRKPPRKDKATGRDRWSIYHDDPRPVENNSFYRRAIRRGDLVEVKPAPSDSPKTGKVAKKKD